VDVVGVHRFLRPEHPRSHRQSGRAAQALGAGGLSVHAQLRRGDPALVIAGVAAEENARLIVVGAGERGELAGRIIGASPTWLPSARPATC